MRSRVARKPKTFDNVIRVVSKGYNILPLLLVSFAALFLLMDHNSSNLQRGCSVAQIQWHNWLRASISYEKVSRDNHPKFLGRTTNDVTMCHEWWKIKIIFSRLKEWVSKNIDMSPNKRKSERSERVRLWWHINIFVNEWLKKWKYYLYFEPRVAHWHYFIGRGCLQSKVKYYFKALSTSS